MNDKEVPTEAEELRRHSSLLSTFEEIAQTFLSSVNGERENGKVFTFLQDYLDGSVLINGAYCSRRAVLLAIHDMKDKQEAPPALQSKTLSKLDLLNVRPVLQPAPRKGDMTMADVQTLPVQIPHELVQYWGWFLAFGIGLLVLGGVAVARSVTATVATMLFFGWLLVFASGIEIAQAVMVGQWAGFFHHLLSAILFGVTGLLLVTRPMISAEVVTVVIAMFLLIGGLFQLIGSLAIALPGWGWQAADGIITLVLGLLVLAQWPASGLWVIGLLVGIDLILYGGAWIALALRLRST